MKWVSVYCVKVENETEEAFLFNFGDKYNDWFWIRKADIKNASGIDKGDQDFIVMVKESVAKQLGLEGA